jgi:hypothetical protein
MTWENIDIAFTTKLTALGFLKSEVLAPEESVVQQWNKRYMLIPKGVGPGSRQSVNGVIDVVKTMDFIYREQLTVQDRAEKVREVVDLHLATLPALLTDGWFRDTAEIQDLRFVGQVTELGGADRPIYVQSVVTFEISDRWRLDS